MNTREAFESIYAENLWGGRTGEFHSGNGSEDHVTASYVEFVRDFIKKNSIRSVADLGCGDFRVGRQLIMPGLSYSGVDIVGPLIETNRRKFGSSEVRFYRCNLAEDELPDAEIGLLRQVLQHLSNAEVLRVLTNCQRYPLLLVTEHVPVGEGVIPNLDKPHGPDVRLYDKSGVFLDRPPFSLSVETVLEVSVAEGEVIRSVIVRNKPKAG